MAALLCGVVVRARADEATQHFEAGRKAFEAQNYQTALQEFAAAVTSGLSGPAVHFNMGVAAYRLGEYSRAEAAFKEVARTPSMAALAYYNLGLVALRRNDRRAASRWFSQASQESSDERLRGLALARLAEIPAEAPAEQRNWVAYAALGAGYDDNVALVSNANVLGVSGKEDSFTELQLAISAPLDQTWQLDAGVYGTDYHSLDVFDLLSVQGGGRYRLSDGDWKSTLGVQLVHTTLDGRGFENRQSVLLQTRRALSREWQLHADYRFSRLDGLNDFEGLSGYRHEVNARMGWAREPWLLDIEYRFDVNDYDDEALSTRRHGLGVEFQRALPGDWSIAVEVAGRKSRYDLESNGTENRTDLALELARSFGTRWRLVAQYGYTDNDADVREFNYQRGRLSAGFEATL